jgi:serine/threonine-protein kinase
MGELHPGDQLDHYRIDSLVARSGMASIFRGTDVRNGTQVAIKVPHPEVESDPVNYDRFHREQDIGQKMDHPGVMKVMADPDRSQVYMVMEWVNGRLLREILRDLRNTHGVVHRDLKPENIMVDSDDRVKLIDFGIAGQDGSRRLTFSKLSSLMGTPDYISPEQVKGKRGDGRSDIYALGVMLYEMLTGEVPFHGPNAFAIMNDRLLNNPVPPRELDPGISPQLQEIIYRAIERDPKNRYSSAREFAWDLQHRNEVGVADRPELREWKRRRSPLYRRILFYAMLALIPVVVFGLLLFVARHS